MRALLRSLAGLAVLSLSALAAAEPDPSSLLREMAWALDRTNYEGVFIHTHLGRSETMKVVHRVDTEGRITERLVSIDGSGREIIRNDDEVRCILPDRRSVFVEKRNNQNPLFANLPQYSEKLGLYYDFVALGAEKLLHLDTRVLVIEPRDEYRYGYKLWLEQSTSLPLKTHLLGEDGGVIEQILFHSITLSDEIPVYAVEPGVDASDFTWYYERDEAPAGSETQPDVWQAADLPPGFRLEATNSEYLPDSDSPTQHIVYTDGLASVSVFVEPGSRGDGGLAPGTSHRGAAFAHTARADEYMVTAVGEVPAVTVKMIADSMRKTTRDARR